MSKQTYATPSIVTHGNATAVTLGVGIGALEGPHKRAVLEEL